MSLPKVLCCLTLAWLGFVWAGHTPVHAAIDYAEARHADAWLRHPVYGDPSFDSFQRCPGNPIHRGTPPYAWPVNGFLFQDPASDNWYIYVGAYGKGYMQPPSRCLLYRSSDHGTTWTNLGVVLEGDARMFDRAGHTPDVSVVFADRRYHMVYDWGEPNFNAEGGLAYAWAERPEGPWHRLAEPITRNSTLPRLLGRYQRTYAATLLRRKHDWLILAMMDYAPHGWALFAITAPQPEGPWSSRQLLLHVEADYYHPPLLEFFPAFTHQGDVYAPATAVAQNRNFNVLFRAKLERAHESEAWRLFQHGSVWHAEDVEHEFQGLWGQTFAGAIDHQETFWAMFPALDSRGCGTINLARRPWNKPLHKRSFVFTGHAGPSLTLLREAYRQFSLEATLQIRGKAALLFDYAAPLNPNEPRSDASLHPLMNTRHAALELSQEAWKLVLRGTTADTREIASGSLQASNGLALRVERQPGRFSLTANGQALWTGSLPETRGPPGVLGLRAEPNTHVRVERFVLSGKALPATFTFGAVEALLGAAEPPANWQPQTNSFFRFGTGFLSRSPTGRAKWNFVGNQVSLWSPRGPEFGQVELKMDGRLVGLVDLHAAQPQPSQIVWTSSKLKNGAHALVLTPRNASMPLDSLDVESGTVRGF